MDKDFAALLSDISLCFLDRDVALWLSRLKLPFSIITKDGPVVLVDAKAVRTNFDLYLRAMDVMGLDMGDRVPLALQDCGDGTWLGTFQTRLLSAGQLATAPYTSPGLLTVEDGRFRMTSMLNGRGHSEWTGVTDA